MLTKPLVHYITRWSGKHEDEQPLCGAAANYRTEIGRTHDICGEPMCICAICADLAAAKEKQ